MVAAATPAAVVPVRARGAGGAPRMVGRESWVVVTSAPGQVGGRTRCRGRRGSAHRLDRRRVRSGEARRSAPPPGSARGVAVRIGHRPVAGAAAPRRIREDRRRHERRAERPRTAADHVLRVEFWSASSVGCVDGLDPSRLRTAGKPSTPRTLARRLGRGIVAVEASTLTIGGIGRATRLTCLYRHHPRDATAGNEHAERLRPWGVRGRATTPRFRRRAATRDDDPARISAVPAEDVEDGLNCRRAVVRARVRTRADVDDELRVPLLVSAASLTGRTIRSYHPPEG